MTAIPADIFLWRALAIFLLIGALLGIAVSLLLIFKPHLLGRINHMANRWISTRHIGQALDRGISIERWFYRHHRPAGIIILLGAAYFLIYFGILFDKATTLLHLSSQIPPRLLDVLLDALVLGSLIGGTVAFITGLLIWLRPSLLRGIEEEANRWVSTSNAAQKLDVPYDQVDQFVARHAQKVGWLLLLASIYLFFVLFRLLA
jgi:hypothetical protein